MVSYPKLVEGSEISQVDDGYVIYMADEDRVHYLNQTAVLVLECCTGTNTVKDIITMVQEAFQLSRPPEEDVTNCLETMIEEGLIA